MVPSGCVGSERRQKRMGRQGIVPYVRENLLREVPHQLVCERQSCRAEYKKRYDADRNKGNFTPAPWYGQFCMPDPYQGKKLYFDGLHSVRGSMPGRSADPVLGF